MTTPPPVPLPVETLSYASDQDNPWPVIVRWIGIASVLSGLRAPLLISIGSFFQSPGGPIRYYVLSNAVGSCASGVGALLLLIAGIQVLRKASGALVLMRAVCIADIACTLVAVLASTCGFLLYYGLNPGPGTLQVLFQSIPRLSLAALPLLILVLLRRFARTPGLQAVFQR